MDKMAAIKRVTEVEWKERNTARQTEKSDKVRNDKAGGGKSGEASFMSEPPPLL